MHQVFVTPTMLVRPKQPVLGTGGVGDSLWGILIKFGSSQRVRRIDEENEKSIRR